MAITVSLSEWDAQKYSYFEAGLRMDFPYGEPLLIPKSIHGINPACPPRWEVNGHACRHQ